jgi:hypothetical protein
MKSMDMIVDSELRPLHIFSRHIDLTCRSYLTKQEKY